VIDDCASRSMNLIYRRLEDVVIDDCASRSMNLIYRRHRDAALARRILLSPSLRCWGVQLKFDWAIASQNNRNVALNPPPLVLKSRLEVEKLNQLVYMSILSWLEKKCLNNNLIFTIYNIYAPRLEHAPNGVMYYMYILQRWRKI